MADVSDVLLIAGPLIGLVGWAWLLVAGFMENVVWGVVLLLAPPTCLVFGFVKWPEYRVPTVLSVVGLALYLAGTSLR